MSGNHSDAFTFFGVVPKNIRWSWSGRSPDGSTVAVRLWQDRFENGGRTYRSWSNDKAAEWTSRPGFTELIENLAYARDHLDGIVRVILLVARDKDASPRSIARSSPQPNLKMRIVELDEEQGTYVLQRANP